MKSISLISHSKDSIITTPILAMIADAITRQLCEHYAGVWQSQGVPMTVCATEKDADKESVLMVIFDAASDPGILGYHDVSPTGKPYSKIFWQPIRDSGGSLCSTDNSLSVTISHEALELIEDPYANAWNDIGDKYGTEDAHELCDRVEGDSYKIDGVAVSNFLGPRAFRKGAGPYDYLGIQGDPRGLLSPFETRPNAYAIRRTGGPLGDTQSIFGAEYPEHRKALKLAQGSRAALRGVAAKE